VNFKFNLKIRVFDFRHKNVEFQNFICKKNKVFSKSLNVFFFSSCQRNIINFKGQVVYVLLLGGWAMKD
jgi:hypothetical protein